MSLFAHPVTQSVALPLAVCAAGLALARSPPAVPVAGAVLTAAVLACVLAMLGVPPWPPRGGMQKLPLLLAAAVLAAVALEGLGASVRMRTAVACVFTVGALGWLAWPVLRDPQPASLAALTAGALAAVAVVVRAGRARVPREFALMLLAGAVALSATAVASASLALAQGSGALTVALAAAGTWMLYKGTLPGSIAMLTWGAVALVMLVALTALLTPVSGWVLAMLALVFVADWPVASRVESPRRTVMVGLLAFSLAAAVVAVTVVLSAAAQSAGDPYY